MKVLEPVVRGNAGQKPLTMEQVAASALVSGRGKAGVATGGATLDDLRRLLVQP